MSLTRPIDSTRLCTKKTCPPRAISASMASRMTAGLAATTWVSIASRSRGGVSMIERSRRPERERCSERGIGVADIARTSIEVRHSLSFSFCATPKRCSSSTISRPRSRKARSLPSIRCVAMRMSTAPSATLRHDLLLLRARAKPREQLDRDGKGREPPQERPEVLVREHRRRREEGHLLAVEHGLEGRAHGDLRFPVADIAAEEPVHRPVGLHVALHVGDGLRLVRRLGVLEGVLELLLPGRVLREGEAGRDAAPGVELQELVGHVAHGALDRGLAPSPAGAAQAVEHRRRVLEPRVLLHQVEPVHGQEQRLLLGIADLHELALLALDRHALQALEESDAVVAVHDGVAQFQVAQVRQEGFREAPAGRRGRLLLAEDLALRVEREPRGAEAETRRDLGREHDERSRLPVGGDRDLVLAGEAAGLLGPSGRAGREEHLLAARERARRSPAPPPPCGRRARRWPRPAAAGHRPPRGPGDRRRAGPRRASPGSARSGGAAPPGRTHRGPDRGRRRCARRRRRLLPRRARARSRPAGRRPRGRASRPAWPSRPARRRGARLPTGAGRCARRAGRVPPTTPARPQRTGSWPPRGGRSSAACRDRRRGSKRRGPPRAPPAAEARGPEERRRRGRRARRGLRSR